MRLKIVGQHPQARGSECVIFGFFGENDSQFSPVRADMRGGPGELSVSGGWYERPMRPGLGDGTAPALVAAEPHADSCRTTGRLIVLSHSWSGRLQINNLDRKYTVDLHSDVTRLLLLDLIDEVMVDVAPLARCEAGAIRLPTLTRETLTRLIVEHRAWFRFVEPDADFAPGFWRRALGFLRPRRQGFKLQIVSRLLPELAGRPAPLGPPPDAGLRDELRLLAAAVEGVALRAPAEA